MKTCMIIDISEAMQKPEFSMRCVYKTIDIPLVTNYVRMIVNLVFEKFFNCSQVFQESFIKLMINDHFPQYPYINLDQVSKDILITLKSEKQSFNNHPNLLNCFVCGKTVLDPLYFQDKIYHTKCKTLSSFFQEQQSIGDQVKQILYNNHLGKLNHTITIAVQISQENCHFRLYECPASTKIGFVVGSMFSNLNEDYPDLSHNKIKLTDFVVYSDDGEIVNVETLSLVSSIHSLTFVCCTRPKSAFVASSRYSSYGIKLLIEPWYLFYHLYFHLPEQLIFDDEKILQAFEYGSYQSTNLTSFIFNHPSTHFFLTNYHFKTLLCKNLPRIVLANIFKDSFIDSIECHSSNTQVEVFTFSDRLTKVNNSEYLNAKRKKFGNINHHLNSLLSTERFDHLIILSPNVTTLKFHTLCDVLKVSIINFNQERNSKKVDPTCSIYQPSHEYEYYQLGQELFKQSMVGTSVSFVLPDIKMTTELNELINLNEINNPDSNLGRTSFIHTPGQTNSLLLSSDILRLKNEFLHAKELFPVGLVNDSIVDWILKINEQSLLIHFTNLWPNEPPQCVFVKFEKSEILYDSIKKSNLFVDRQNKFCLPLLSKDWQPKVTASMVIKQICESFNNNFAATHKNYFVNYSAAIYYYD